MMNTRIQKLIDSENLSPSKFAEIIGVQRSSISHILSGRNKPSFDLIHSILTKFPKVSPDWLLMGNGNIYRQMVQGSLFDSAAHSIPFEPKPPADNPAIEPTKASDKQTDEPIFAHPKAPENSIFPKSIERVLVFYSDKTFTEYKPES